MELMTSNNSLTLEAERQIIAFKEATKAIEEQQKKFNEQLIKEMKKRGITAYKDENMTITLFPESTVKRFDSKAFKKKFPDVYEKFTKENTVSEYVKVMIKKEITSENMVENVTPQLETVLVINGETETF